MSKIRSSPIIKLFRPYFKLEFIILSLMSINAVFNLANPILLRVVIDKVLILRQINLLKEILIILIAIYILRNVSSYLIGYFNTYIGEKYSFELHHEIIKRIQKAKLTEVNSLTAGDFINKSINDVNIITGFLSGTVVSILNISFDLLAMLGLMLFFSVKLSLISIVVTIIYIYISIRFGKLIKRNQENIRVKSSEYISLLGRIFSSIRSIKAYNKETHYLRKHCSLFRKIINLDFEAFFYSFGYNSLLSFVGFLGAIITLVVGISDVFRGALTIGTLFVFDTLIKTLSPKVNISPCYLSCFPGSQVFDNSDEYQVVKKSSPSLLPFRTFFDKYDMRLISKSLGHLNITSGSIYRSENVVNDAIGYFSGIYTDRKFNGLRHLEISSLDTKTLAYLKSNLDLNGSIIIPTENLRLNSKLLFCEDRKRLKVDLRNYDENLERLVSSNVFPVNQLFYRRSGVTYYFQVNNSYQERPITADILEDSEENILSLINRVNQGVDRGSFNLKEFSEWYINQCGISGQCLLGKVRRLNLSENKVRLCVSRGDYTQQPMDPSFRLLSHIKQVLEEMGLKRDCMHCMAQDICPKCAFPFSNNYCRIIQNNYTAIKYLKLITYLKSFRTDDLDVRLLEEEKEGLVLTVDRNKCFFSNINNQLYYMN